MATICLLGYQCPMDTVLVSFKDDDCKTHTHFSVILLNASIPERSYHQKGVTGDNKYVRDITLCYMNRIL